MDRDQFDALARRMWTRQSRRTALATGVGALLLGSVPNLVAAKKNGNGNGTGRKGKKKKRNVQQAASRRRQSCVARIDSPCSVFDPDPCGGCPGMVCTSTLISPLLTTCQAECSSSDGTLPSCQERYGPKYECLIDPLTCTYLGFECCKFNPLATT